MILFDRARRRHDREKLAAFDRSLAIAEFSPDGVILSANENFCKLMDYAQAEIVGKHHRLFVEPMPRNRRNIRRSGASSAAARSTRAQASAGARTVRPSSSAR